MKFLKKHCPFTITLILVILSHINLRAIPAYPFPLEIKQPNGEIISVRLHGDEYFHYKTSGDNYVVEIDENGYYTFAEISEKGQIIAGKIKVSSNSLRSTSNNFLKADSPEFIEKVLTPATSKFEEQNQLRASKAATAYTGNRRVLVILANFKDTTFVTPNAREEFSQMYNQVGYNKNGATGSAKDYFSDNSQGRFVPQFDVYGPVDLPQTMAYYGLNNSRTIQMTTDACNAAIEMYEDLDFNNYVNDQPGVIDNVFIVYAGFSEAESKRTNNVWPLQSNPESLYIKGLKLGSFACTAELSGKYGNTMSGVGVFIHEYSHSLGLPDLYDVNDGTNGQGTGLGTWSIMSLGNYLNEGKTPPLFNSMERNMLGWLEPTLLTADKSTQHITLESISSDIAYRINTPTEDEYFLLENRKIEKWDSFLLYDYVGKYNNSGLLIYHVDKSSFYPILWNAKRPNIYGDHPCFQLVAANPLPSSIPTSNYWGIIEAYKWAPYPGDQNVKSISDTTTPSNLKSWNGKNSNVIIENITRNGDNLISFDFKSSLSSDIKQIKGKNFSVYTKGNRIFFKNIKEKTIVEIFDIQGKLCSKKIIGNATEDYIEVNASGIYIIKLKTNNEIYIEKIHINI